MGWAEILSKMYDLEDSMEDLRGIYFRTNEKDNDAVEDILSDIRGGLGEFITDPEQVEAGLKKLESYEKGLSAKAPSEEKTYLNRTVSLLKEGIKNRSSDKTAEGIFRLEYYAGSLLGGD